MGSTLGQMVERMTEAGTTASSTEMASTGTTSRLEKVTGKMVSARSGMKTSEKRHDQNCKLVSFKILIIL